MISTTPTPVSQRAEPSPVWSGTFPKRRTGRGTTRISRVRCETAMRGFASRVPLPARRGDAPHGREEGGESDPGFFGAGAPRAGEKGGQASGHLFPPLGGGRSHHRDPWREGHRADEEAGAATSTTGGVPCERKRRLRRQQPESGAGRNGCRHKTLRRRRPVRPFITLGHLWFSVDEPHSLSIPPLCQVFLEGRTPVWLASRQSFL